MKVVEKSGTTLKSILVNSYPWAGGKCGRRRCLPCKARVESSKCRKRNILYESTCQECLGAGEDYTYVGKSSRSGYERAINHMDDYKDRHEDSHMWGHALAHNGGRLDVKLKFVIDSTDIWSGPHQEKGGGIYPQQERGV